MKRYSVADVLSVSLAEESEIYMLEHLFRYLKLMYFTMTLLYNQWIDSVNVQWICCHKFFMILICLRCEAH